jgi:hypothetical protein
MYHRQIKRKNKKKMRVFCHAMPSEQGVHEIKAPWLLTQAGLYLPNTPLLGHYLPHSVHMPKIRHVLAAM